MSHSDCPYDIICPLTGNPMVEPVVAEDGYTYERAAISQRLACSPTSPTTGNEMGTVLIPNMSLSLRITSWRTGHVGGKSTESTVSSEYHRLLQNANAPIFGIDVHGNVNVWNRMAAEITEYTRADTMGHHLVTEFITPEYRDAVQGVLDRALLGDESANFEFPLVTRSGKRVEVLLNATTRRDKTGNIEGVVGIGQDISKRKVAEDKLAEVAQDLTTLIDTANAPIFGIDQRGRVNEWNQKAAEITEYGLDEVMGQNLVERFIHPEYQSRVKAVLDSALLGMPTANFEFPLWTKSEQRRQVLFNANPRRNASNEIVGVVGVGQDITSRLVQEREYVRLIDTANAPIFGIDVHGNVNVWNKTAAQITEFPNAEVLGHNLVNEFITPDFRSAVQTVLDRALLGEETANFEFPVITKSDRRVEVLLNATSRRDARGNIVGVVGIGQDITARKKMERAKMTFLASFSHELRTPLNGLLGMLELLADESLPETARRKVFLANNSSRLLLSLINDILDLSKIEAGQLMIAHEPFDLRQAIQSATELLRAPLNDKGLQFVLDIKAPVPQKLVGDVMRLRQVLLNLLSNAIKFTQQGKIYIRCWTEPVTVASKGNGGHNDKSKTKVYFQVEDTGIGMHEENMVKLFTLFTKIADDRVVNASGSGLGLAICRQLVTLMGGSINVASKYGVGSTFTFFVLFERFDDENPQHSMQPLARFNQPWTQLTRGGHVPEMTTPPAVDMGNVVVLIAEDNPFNWDVTQKFLDMSGASYVWAQNGLEALEKYKADPFGFDIILMDCQMPILDGYDATRKIREFETSTGDGSGSGGDGAAKTAQNMRIPIVALTAHAMLGDHAKCIESGMDGYLTKPISRRQLLQAIVHHMRRPLSRDTKNANAHSSADQQQQQDQQRQENPVNIEKGPRPVDLQALAARFGSELIAKQTLEKFQQYLPSAMDSVRDMCARKDLACLNGAAHSIKGAAGMASAVLLEASTRKLVAACRHALSTTPPTKYEAVQATIDSLVMDVEEACRAVCATKG